MAKFWILYLTLTKSSILSNGMADLAVYGVENSCDNRLMLADFLPEDFDQEEVEADNFLLEKWQEHIKLIDVKSPGLESRLEGSPDADADPPLFLDGVAEASD